LASGWKRAPSASAPGGDGMLTVPQPEHSLSADIARFVRAFAGSAPRRATEIACAGFADTIGVMFAGTRESEEATIVDRALGTGGRGAFIIPGMRECSPSHAALVNATAAHALDYDDVALDGHPSAVLVPAILAVAGERTPTGRQIVDAYLVGYEVWAALCERKTSALHNFGWHPTCVFGAITAAAACSFLAQLSEQQIQFALGIAASMTSGLMGNFGSMTKPFQVGRAAEAGVVAARLARAGLTSSTTIFERSPGFFDAFYRDAPLSAPPIGERRHIEATGLNVKRYPICYCAQRAVDGVLGLIRRHSLQASDVASVAVQIGDVQNRILRFSEANSVPEAKFCLEYCVAVTLAKGRLGLAELSPDLIHSPAIKGLMKKVSREVVPSAPGDVFAPADRVSIVTQDGRRLDSGPIAHAKGSFETPLSKEELFDKFSDCLGPGRDPTRVRTLFDRCFELDRAPSIDGLVAALRAFE